MLSWHKIATLYKKPDMNNCIIRRRACAEQIFRSNMSPELLHITKKLPF